MATKTRDEAVIIAGLINMIDYYLEGRIGWFDLADLVVLCQNTGGAGHERLVAALTKQIK